MQSVIVPEQLRSDCGERYESIIKNCKTGFGSVVDIGCSNGYFMARFINDGADVVVGVDPDEQYKSPNIFRSISDVSGEFDVCLYLDLHYHDGIDYFPWIKKHAKIAFISPSGVGNNKRIEIDLEKEFGNFEFISKSAYADRNIYKVVNELN